MAEIVKRLSFLVKQSDSEAAAKGVRGSKGLEQLPSQLVAPVTTLKFPGEQEVHTEASVSELEEIRVELWKVGRGWNEEGDRVGGAVWIEGRHNNTFKQI